MRPAVACATPIVVAFVLGLGGISASAQTGSNNNTTATAAPRSTTTTRPAAPQTIIVRIPSPSPAPATTTTTTPPPDTSNQDSDGDGVADLAEGVGDVDGDGIPNHLDAHDHWITGTVFVDEDGDSLAGPDDTDPGAVNLQLHSAGADGAIDTADDELIARASASNYRFSNLNDGVYRIRIAPAQGYSAGSAPIVQLDGAAQSVMIPLSRDAEPATTPTLAFDDGSDSFSRQALVLVAFAAAAVGLLAAGATRHRDSAVQVLQLVDANDKRRRY